VASPVRGTPASDTILRPTFAYGKLPARDIERARRFYAGALGVHPFAERDGHLYYDIGGCRFMVFTSVGSASARTTIWLCHR
jgi:catechol-2,3-dioxygenase